MNRDYFRLIEKQFARLEPLLPTDTRGKPRVDDRRLISGIVHVLSASGGKGGTKISRSAGRAADAPRKSTP